MAEFRQRLLTAPGERREAEYKKSILFEPEREFGLKILRQIQGMANTGGGWIIIGFEQQPNGMLIPDPNHEDAVCGSYEPTRLLQQASSSVARGQVLRATVHFERHPDTGLRYPLIQVEGFERTPFVSRSTKSAADTGQVVLEEGVVYFRRQGAETSKVVTPGDWEEIISRAVANRRSEYLAEFKELLSAVETGRELPTAAAAVTQADLDVWAGEARIAAWKGGSA